MKKSTLTLTILMMVSVAIFGLVSMNGTQSQVFAADDAKAAKPDAKSKFAPVDNMHHFMEYINEPVYESIEAALKSPPKDKATWGKVKSGALILAETSGLVAQRGDNSKDEDWQSSSMTVYTEGKKLYQAARKKDYDSAQKFLKSMTAGCQKCHEAFRQ